MSVSQMAANAAEAVKALAAAAEPPYYPGLPDALEVDAVLDSLADLAGQLGVTLGRLDSYLIREHQFDRLEVWPPSPHAGDPLAAIAATSEHLQDGRDAATHLAVVLEQARAAIAGAATL